MVDSERMLAKFGYAELHADGSGFAASSMWRKREQVPRPQVFDERIASSQLAQVEILTNHAIANCMASGDAAISATLLGPETGEEVGTGILLVHGREGIPDALGSRPVFAPQASHHSFSLDTAYRSGTELVSVGSMLMSDLVQSFGLAEPLQISRSGTIRRQYFQSTSRRSIEAWASSRDVEVTDETV